MVTRNGLLLLAVLQLGLPLQLIDPAAPPVVSRKYLARVPIPDQPEVFVAELVLPPGVTQVRAVLVFLKLTIDAYVFDNRDWQAMCARVGCAMMRVEFPSDDPGSDTIKPTVRSLIESTTGDGIQVLLDAFAQQTALPGLADAGLVFWGFSGMGGVAARLANWAPTRTIGFVSYHGVPAATLTTPPYVRRMDAVPGLIMQGGNDTENRKANQEEFLRRGRAAGAPWALASHAGAEHYSIDALIGDMPLMLRWIESVINLRTPPVPPTRGRRQLQTLAQENGFVGSPGPVPIKRASVFDGDPATTSWLPDRATARAWLFMRGACDALPMTDVIAMLGPTARIVVDRGSEQPYCEYSATRPNGEALTLSIRFSPLHAGPRGLLEVDVPEDFFTKPPAGATAVAGLGDTAYTHMEEDARCTVLTSVFEKDTMRVSLCGGDSASRSAAGPTLERILRRIAGDL
jgi:hypothetical protein